MTTPHRRGFAAFAIALTVVLSAVTVLVVLYPRLSLVLVDVRLELVINTAATLTAGAVAGLGWIQFREARRTASLYQSSAFLTLVAVNGMFVAFTVLRLDEPLGISALAPRQGSLYVWTLARATVALLLLVAALAAIRGWRPPRQAALLLLAPAIGVLVLFAVLLPVQDRLPPLFAGDALTLLEFDTRVPSLLPGVTRGGVVIQGVTGAMFLVGAYLNYRLYSRDDRIENGFLCIGLIVAAISQVQFALYPTAYTSLLSTGDLLRVAFYGLLLLGALAATRSDVRALEEANANLGRLRDAEVAAAALQERARLAREVHDGLAQDLFFAKLKQGRLAGLRDLSRTSRALVEELGSAIENALAEARQVVMAMRLEPSSEDDPFAETLRRFVDDFGDRVGVRTEFIVDRELPPLSPRVQAELLRIVQEALNNASKHADPTLVRVVAGVESDELRLTVSDNGRGFEPARLDGRGFGLESMRDRAAVIGARLTVDSRPLDGTRVTAQVPLGAGGVA